VSWWAFAIYALLGPILGAVLPAVIAVAVLSHEYSGPLWVGSTTAWIALIGSAAVEGLIPAVLTAISLRILPGRTRPRVRSALAYGLISAFAALILLLPFRGLDGTGQIHLEATAVLGGSGLLAGFLCAVIVQYLNGKGLVGAAS
jgi:hypothetical protein